MENFGRDLGRMINAMALLIVLFVPLGIYQAAQMVWWLVTHISFR